MITHLQISAKHEDTQWNLCYFVLINKFQIMVMHSLYSHWYSNNVDFTELCIMMCTSSCLVSFNNILFSFEYS